MNVVEFIRQRREAEVHRPEDLRKLVDGAVAGTIPDYQLAAWLMAAVFRPLTMEETVVLTQAMAASGDRVDLTGLPKPWLDKHSTGGVGDKTTLVILPLLAACGITTMKMSGRGLGITGGTIDKLESLVGFRTDFSADELRQQAATIGIAISGQSPRLAPADGVFYALRDVTATVESVPLIASSIMSKKLASGADHLVLDVKVGRGAFLPDLPRARELAEWLVEIGRRSGIRTRSVLTQMDQPLGAAAGNALEVREAMRVLDPAVAVSGPEQEFRELVLDLAGHGLEITSHGGRNDAVAAWESGRANEMFRRWMKAQGGDPDQPWPSAPVIRDVPAPLSGEIARIDARIVGEVVRDLGGGRQRKGDAIDPRVGVTRHVSVGDSVTAGQPLLTVHASSEAAAETAIDRLTTGLTVQSGQVEPLPMILGVVG